MKILSKQDKLEAKRRELHDLLDNALDAIASNGHTGRVGLWLECQCGGIAAHSWTAEKSTSLLIISDGKVR